jgi:agmatine/peptidylarginine deiminase
MLSRIGYNVIRVPWLEGDGSPTSPWPGVSYANAAIVGRTVFVPKLGLGRKEEAWLDELQQQLPERYDVVATPATALVLENGGIHCALAFGRGTAGNP